MTMSKTILVVDDMEKFRSDYRCFLDQLGHTTIEAEDGYAGLKLLEQQKIDIIFLDFNMPGMDGFEFADQVHTKMQDSAPPIVMMSTDIAKNQQAVATKRAKCWMAKPSTLTMVEQAISQC
ncbi:MAG: response regulator [Alphaproteobacteria bacterium]